MYNCLKMDFVYLFLNLSIFRSGVICNENVVHITPGCNVAYKKTTFENFKIGAFIFLTLALGICSEDSRICLTPLRNYLPLLSWNTVSAVAASCPQQDGLSLTSAPSCSKKRTRQTSPADTVCFFTIWFVS